MTTPFYSFKVSLLKNAVSIFLLTMKCCEVFKVLLTGMNTRALVSLTSIVSVFTSSRSGAFNLKA